MRWLRTRVISPNRVRMYLARVGISMLSSFSTASEKHCSVGHHGHVVEAVKVGQRLQVRLVLAQLLGAAVQQSDVRVRAYDLLAVELEDQPQHAVGCWVLRPKVDRVVPDLAVLD